MVRVALEAAQKKGALVSLMVVGIAAASILVGYLVWHKDSGAVAAQRELPDVIVGWRCPQGHVFEEQGAYSARPCPTCRQPARILVTYLCPKQHQSDALVMYDEGTRMLSAVRFDLGEWIKVDQIIPCPKCGGELRPKQRGPFDRRPAATGQDAAPTREPG